MQQQSRKTNYVHNNAVGKANLNSLKKEKGRDNYLNGTKQPLVKHSQLEL